MQVVLKDLEAALGYIYSIKDMLGFVSKTRSAEDLSNQIENSREIFQSFIKFDEMKIMLFDPYLRTFFETVKKCLVARESLIQNRDLF